MDFGDYIYIIIGVLWFIFSIIGGAAKAAKKKQAQAAKTQSPKQTNTADADLKRVIDELLQGKKEKVLQQPKKQTTAPRMREDRYVKKSPVKLETHQKHESFMTYDQKKKKKPLDSIQESLSSHTEPISSTTSHQQHPPVQTQAEPGSGSIHQLKNEIAEVHPLLAGFNPQKAFLYAEIFGQKKY